MAVPSEMINCERLNGAVGVYSVMLLGRAGVAIMFNYNFDYQINSQMIGD